MKVQLNARNRAHSFEAGRGRQRPVRGTRSGGGAALRVRQRHLRHLQGAARVGRPARRLARSAGAQVPEAAERVPDVPVHRQDAIWSSRCRASCTHGRRRVRAGQAWARIKGATLLTGDVMLLDVVLDRADGRSTPGSSCWCACRASRASAAGRWSTTTASAKRCSSWSRRSPAAASRMAVRRRAHRARQLEVFGPLGSATFYPSIAQEHPVHRRRQRHRRHDVDRRAARCRRATSRSSTATCSSACAR